MPEHDGEIGPVDECPDICARQAAAQLLGPLRTNVCVCAHGVHRRLDDVFPKAKEAPRGR